MRYIVFNYTFPFTKGFATEFRMLAFLNAFVKKLLGGKEYIYDTEERQLIYTSGVKSVQKISGPEAIFYHCIECGKHFGCNDKGQFWCVECAHDEACFARFVRHKDEAVSHGICRTCFTRVSLPTKHGCRA